MTDWADFIAADALGEMPDDLSLGDWAMLVQRSAAVLRAERARCAKIAETEPEPNGPLPSGNWDLEKLTRAAIRVTRKSIATRIWEEEKP